jgi:hypothetical protein
MLKSFFINILILYLQRIKIVFMKNKAKKIIKTLGRPKKYFLREDFNLRFRNEKEIKTFKHFKTMVNGLDDGTSINDLINEAMANFEKQWTK